MSPYRPEFEAALRLFARISEAMEQRGFTRPVLVGGAAAEFWSTSALTTGDFDICTPVQPEVEEEMQRLGFIRPSGSGMSTRGWIHPELKLGFEIVADVPMDGSVDTAHVHLVQPVGETALFRIISVEDLIADRMGQYASGTARTGSIRHGCCSPFTRMPISTILSGVYVRKVSVSSGSKMSKAEGGKPVIDMAALGERIAARRAELGNPEIPRNSGTRRTPSKRALLKAIEDAGGKW